MSTLVEARESLTYWEHRLAQLPRSSVRARREAREMIARCRERVDAAERDEYGQGLLGAVFMAMAEKRLPAHTKHQIVRVGKGAAMVAVAGVAAMVLLTVVLFAVLLALIF